MLLRQEGLEAEAGREPAKQSKAQGLPLGLHQLGGHPSKPRTPKGEVGRSEVQGHPWLYSRFKASLRSMKPVLLINSTGNPGLTKVSSELC